MGKKKKAEMDAQRARFAEGAAQKGVNPEKAQFIFDLVAKFAGYGFNKSHAAAYALVAYQTAWLKANYPVEFLAASMTLDLGNTDKLNFFRQELGRQNIPLLPPDINRSQVEFSVDETGEGKERRLAVRYALAAIKNVGRQAMEGLLAEREAGGRFTDLFDFAGRIDPHQINKRQMENLVRAGAFDSLNDNRAQVFQAVETLLRTASAAAEDRVSGQTSLFGDAGGAPQHPALPEVTPWRHMEKLQEEFAAIGFFLTAHPIDAYARALRQQKVVSSGDIAARVQAGRTGFKLAGVIARVQERKSARGNPFAFVELSDAAGSFEVTVFSEILSSARALLEPGKAIVVTVEARLEDESARLTAQRIEAVEAVVANAGTGMSLRLENADGLELIGELLDRHRRGRGFVSLLVELDGGARQVEIELPQRYSITPDMIEALSQTPGVLEAREI
jgi:DNA polymerase-3 subunit alpha